MTIHSQAMEKCVTGFGAALATAAVGLFFSMSANAQDDSIFEEIVVTVQKREQNIMDVPVAVSAVTGAAHRRSRHQGRFRPATERAQPDRGQSQTATTT